MRPWQPCWSNASRPATTVPATTVPATTVPATTVPATTVPATTVPATAIDTTVGAGWFLTNAHDDELIWKDGGTGGCCSFIGRSTRTGRAVVLRSNADSDLTTPEIGMHLINDAFPIPELQPFVTLDPAKLDRLAGRYALTPSVILTITPRDRHMMAQVTDQTEAEVFPLSELRFAYRIIEAELSFTLGGDGIANALVLHQNGCSMRPPRRP